MHSEGRQPLRILHVTTTMDRGGAENHIHDLIVGQIARGEADVVCAYLKGEGYWRESLERKGVKVVDLKMKTYGSLAPLFAMRRLVRSFRPDIIHAHGAPAELYALAAKALLRRRPKLVFTRHELRFRLFAIPGYKLADTMLSRAADRVIAVSQAVREADIARSPLLDTKSEVIHHGFDADFDADAAERKGADLRSEWGVPDGALLIGTVARLSPEKSLDTLLRAFAVYVAATQPSFESRMVLVGRGPLEAELRALAGQLGISSKVIWAGFRDDMPAVFAAFDVFAFTSVLEGFGLVLLEAMAASKPIVAADIYAPPAILGEGNALLFPPHDANHLAQCLQILAMDAGLRKRLGQAGNRRLRDAFGLSLMIDKTGAAYDRVLRAD